MVNKQKLHGLLLNIKIYSLDVSNIQRRNAELNINSPRLNKFDTKRKSIQYLLYDILLFKKFIKNVSLIQILNFDISIHAFF